MIDGDPHATGYAVVLWLQFPEVAYGALATLYGADRFGSVGPGDAS